MAIDSPPSGIKDWAIDSTFDTNFGPSGSAWHGESNKVEPVATRISQGYVPSQSLDAESLNYNFATLYNYSEWSSSSIDDHETTIQETNISSSTGFFTYKGGVRSRSVFFSPFMLGSAATTTAAGQSSWFGNNAGEFLTSVTNSARIQVDANQFLPDGATITAIEAKVQPGAARASGSRMLLTMATCTPDFGSGAAPTWTKVDLDFDDGGTTRQALSASISQSMDKENQIVVFYLVSGNDAGTNQDDVYYFRLTYDDPGPRNF